MKDTRITVDECFECNKQIKEGEEYFTWGNAYCSKGCLEDGIKANMSDVIEDLAEVHIG